jgi:cytochrome b pre-mRNA-processing protein 3
MLLARLIGRDPLRIAAHRAYVAIVAAARAPVFYAEHGVPDTLDGRFELIALHAFLVLHRLKGEAGKEFGQALFDVLFADMDRTLREMGVGDLSVGKQVKAMATAFYGRIAAYQSGLAGEADLADMLKRNLFGTVAAPSAADLDWFAAYLRIEEAALAQAPTAELTAGRIPFVAAPV